MLSRPNAYRLTGLPPDTPAKDLRQALKKIALRARLDSDGFPTLADVNEAERRLETPVERVLDRLDWNEDRHVQDPLTEFDKWTDRFYDDFVKNTITEDALYGFDPPIQAAQVLEIKRRILRRLEGLLSAQLEEYAQNSDWCGAGLYLQEAADAGVESTTLYRLGKTAAQEAADVIETQWKQSLLFDYRERLSRYRELILPLLEAWEPLADWFPQIENVLPPEASRPSLLAMALEEDQNDAEEEEDEEENDGQEQNSPPSPATGQTVTTPPAQGSVVPIATSVWPGVTTGQTLPSGNPLANRATEIRTVPGDFHRMFEAFLNVITSSPLFIILFFSGILTALLCVFCLIGLPSLMLRSLVEPTPRGKTRSPARDFLDHSLVALAVVGPFFLENTIGPWAAVLTWSMMLLSPFYFAWVRSQTWGEMWQSGKTAFAIGALGLLVFTPPLADEIMNEPEKSSTTTYRRNADGEWEKVITQTGSKK